jgi:hypothetical protein
VRYESRRVWCATRAQPAVVSVVERDDTGTPLSFVPWCSLRRLGACDERCLAAARDRPHDRR